MAVKVKKKGKVHPCTGHTDHRGRRGIALPFLDHGTRRGWDKKISWPRWKSKPKPCILYQVTILSSPGPKIL